MLIELEQIEVPDDERDWVDDLGVPRPGDCYEMAGRYVAFGPGFGGRGGAVLVHGTARIGPVRIGHGWALTPGGAVYDGSMGGFYEKEAYYRAAGAVEEVRYSATQARRKMSKHKHWGCWHATSGLVKRKDGSLGYGFEDEVAA